MARIYSELSELIGNTPLIDLQRIRKSRDIQSRILAKIEYLNPAGSIKDRTAWSIIKEAEKSGRLRPGDLLVDITSGNTGIGLAAVAASRGYRTKFYLRDIISQDKINILRQFGAEVVLVDNNEFLVPDGIFAVLERIKRENPEAFFTDQRTNPANPLIHAETTGPEIWQDTGGAVDILVGTVGTGGTISGAGRFLKERKPELHVVVCEPTADSVPTKDNPYAEAIEGVHKVTEVDETHLPETYDSTVVDEVIAVTTAQAREMALLVAREEGLLVGTSSGAAVSVALVLAARPQNVGKNIVVIIPDSGERYLSSASVAAER
ncbi:PLP-dependent cysteine synthase family protein [Rhizobium rhizogenes]|uniref:PLP-dependent cysteine synthase family protein n=1 Tax=Rhizobium rhizogenes TaxID=359 RepID=UPI0015727F00|nr:pyridoxal-phosphate dependent enzyme [Rhizobium rhizogenes]NTF96055.1 cysteine synthase family protein [Rhizobium rhizogenes]